MSRWLDWLTENPFLSLELRRRGRPAEVRRTLIFCLGLPVLIVLAVAAYVAIPGQTRQPTGPRGLGLVLLTIVTAVHLAVRIFVIKGAALHLETERKEGRIEALRLLPSAGTALLTQIGLSRLAVRSAAALLPLPVFGLLLTYGGVRADDLTALALLLTVPLLAPPSKGEVEAALAGDSGPAGTAPASTRRERVSLSRVLRTWLVWLPGPIVFLLVTGQLFRTGGAMAGALLNQWLDPAVRELFPFSVMVAAARAVGQPQPFYHTELALGWPLLAWWTIQRSRGLRDAALLWDGKPNTRTKEGDPPRPALLIFQYALNSLVALLILGLLWPALESPSTLAMLGASRDPGMGLAVLLTAAGGLPIVTLFDQVRNTPLREGSEKEVRSSVLGTLRWTACATAVVAAACAFGNTPWGAVLHTGAVLSGLVLTGAACGEGWRRLRLPKAGEGWLPAELVTSFGPYALPVAALAFPLTPIWVHGIAACSPLYGVLALVPALWPRPSPLSALLQVILPGLVGCALLLVRRPERSTTAPASLEAAGPANAYAPRDWLEIRLAALAERWDDPIFTLELRRLLRGEEPLAYRLLTAPAALVGLTVGIGVLLLSGWRLPDPASLGASLARTSTPGGPSVGAAAALVGALGVLLMGGMWVSAELSYSDEPINRTLPKRRLPLVLISPLGDRELLRGLLRAGILASLPGCSAAVTGSLIWVLFALCYGAGPLWAATWVAVIPGVGAFLLLGGLSGFFTWSRERLRGRQLVVRRLRDVGIGIAFIGSALPPVWLLIHLARNGQAAAGVLAASLYGTALACGMVPLAYRRAFREVERRRREDALE